MSVGPVVSAYQKQRRLDCTRLAAASNPSQSAAITPWSEHACLIRIHGGSALRLLKGVCARVCVCVCVCTRSQQGSLFVVTAK